VFFVIPWLGKTLLGTTDTEDDSPPDQLVITPEDADYLLEGFNHYFRTPLQEHDLLGQFVGLRPLLRSRPAEPSALSREFHVFESPCGLLSVAGGKYTTYRHMAEVITDRVVKHLGLRRRERTSRQLLDGAPREPWPDFREQKIAELQRQGLSEEIATHLVQRYGRRAPDVWEYARKVPSLAQPIHPDEPDICAEFVYQREHEMALLPEDFLLRRTRIGLFHPERLRNAAPLRASG
jgi:glycerol-3-phosphate dehydrogenase